MQIEMRCFQNNISFSKELQINVNVTNILHCIAKHKT
jgi:hypothetical protein